MKLDKKIIEVSNLKKSYGDIEAVKGIDFYVDEGSLFAFLGLNGAGKSTTIDMMCTFLKADSGKIKIDNYEVNKDDDKIKSLIGVVFQDSVLDDLLTVKENLKVRSKLYNMSKSEFDKNLEEIAHVTSINDFLNRQYGKLSGGQRRRADIARALINKPKILFLDEPTTGLDPNSRKSVWDMIRRLQEENNMTVFLTTHYMEEAASADYVVILDSGSIVSEGTPHDLKNQYADDVVALYGVTEEQVQLLGKQYRIIRDGYQIMVRSTNEATELIVAHPEMFQDYEVIKGGMDDVFLEVTGKRLGGDEA